MAKNWHTAVVYDIVHVGVDRYCQLFRRKAIGSVLESGIEKDRSEETVESLTNCERPTSVLERLYGDKSGGRDSEQGLNLVGHVAAS